MHNKCKFAMMFFVFNDNTYFIVVSVFYECLHLR